MKRRISIFLLPPVAAILTLAIVFTAGTVFSARRLGDINGDGDVSAEDARLALRVSVGLETLDKEETLAADADGDQSVTPADARLILRAVVGLAVLAESDSENGGGKTNATSTDPTAPEKPDSRNDVCYVPTMITIRDDYMPEESRMAEVNLKWQKGGVVINDSTYIAFDKDGLLEGGVKHGPVFSYTPFAFQYEGDLLQKVTATTHFYGSSDVDGGQIDSHAAFDSRGQLTDFAKSYLTDGRTATLTYGKNNVASAYYFGGSFTAKTEYRYEDRKHPDRITSAVMKKTDSNAVVTMSYSYSSDGMLSFVAAESAPYDSDVGESGESASSSDFLIRFRYDDNNCLTMVEYSRTNPSDKTAKPIFVTTRIAYSTATEAQYRAFQQINSCSFNNILPGTFIPTANNARFHFVSLFLPLDS